MTSATTLGSTDLTVVREVFSAIAHGRIFFRYEAVCAVNAWTNVLYQEALVRIKTPDSVLLPGAFIPTLEKLSAIREFDRLIVGRTIDAITAMPGARLGCNVSAASALDDHWWEPVFRQLESNPEAASRLVVEITESAPVSPLHGGTFIDRLRKLGVRVAIDDFGRGFSRDTASACAADIIKVDRSFLWRARHDLAGVAELRSTIRAAQRIARVVIAEGVETLDDVRIVRDAGVHWIQGYLLDGATSWTGES
ncbi:EAL domain-containing protein [Paraburkholderia sp. ZP32-5]|uniref:EAL domain-containing protein n=1 Tax=Paraburkholderia sp. ZP32-5 TaxID=2883245 RepID=UPI001F3CF85A|nr:EAL domain-containing protein [Paraburkholderia sp. ZP32-5]